MGRIIFNELETILELNYHRNNIQTYADKSQPLVFALKMGLVWDCKASEFGSGFLNFSLVWDLQKWFDVRVMFWK